MIAAMTQTPEQPTATNSAAEDERARGGAPTIQPVLIGVVLATLIGAIMLAAFWVN